MAKHCILDNEQRTVVKFNSIHIEQVLTSYLNANIISPTSRLRFNLNGNKH